MITVDTVLSEVFDDSMVESFVNFIGENLFLYDFSQKNMCNKHFIDLVFQINKITFKSIPSLFWQSYIYFALKRDPNSISQPFTIALSFYSIYKAITVAYTYDYNIDPLDPIESNTFMKIWNQIKDSDTNVVTKLKSLKQKFMKSKLINIHINMVKYSPFLMVHMIYSQGTVFLICSSLCISEDKLYLIFLYLSTLLFWSSAYQIYVSQSDNKISEVILFLEEKLFKSRGAGVWTIDQQTLADLEKKKKTEKNENEHENQTDEKEKKTEITGNEHEHQTDEIQTFKVVITSLLTPFFIFKNFSGEDELVRLHLFTTHIYSLSFHFVSLLFLCVFIYVNDALPMFLLIAVISLLGIGIISVFTFFVLKVYHSYKENIDVELLNVDDEINKNNRLT